MKAAALRIPRLTAMRPVAPPPAPCPVVMLDASVRLDARTPSGSVHTVRSGIYAATTEQVHGERFYDARIRAHRVREVHELSDGTWMSVHSPRGLLERDQLLLDAIISMHPAVAVGESLVGFVVHLPTLAELIHDNRNASGALYGHLRELQATIVHLAETREHVERPGSGATPASSEPIVPRIVTGTRLREHESSIRAAYEAAGRTVGPELYSRPGVALIVLSGAFLRIAHGGVSMTYSDRTIRRLARIDYPLARAIVRYALSHEYVPGHVLRDVVEQLRGPAGSGFRTARERLMSAEIAEHLRGFGISIATIKTGTHAGELGVFRQRHRGQLIPVLITSDRESRAALTLYADCDT
jgi:hypothetical protein